MADEKTEQTPAAAAAATKDQIALEMMKFIAVTTGYGKGSTGTGFGKEGKSKSPEEYADALIELFARCRNVIG